MAVTLSEQLNTDVAGFEEHGYVVLPGLLAAGEVAGLGPGFRRGNPAYE
jgi:hypothetical protein